MLHCGFYNGNGGFKISVEDRNYMQACYAVVSTCTFGGGDDLYQPIGMVEESLSKVHSVSETFFAPDFLWTCGGTVI